MKKLTVYILLLGCLCCKTEDDTSPPDVGGDDDPQNLSCDASAFPDWSTSPYVLPYTVGTTFPIGLSACTSSYHAEGQPDQFAIDFNMPIDTEIRASTNGTVLFVEESGVDFAFPNNRVVVSYSGMYVQYMHLTENGAAVTVGQTITKGQLIGYSGATGLAGYPHLHFVVTSTNGWEYPYVSVPVTFSNTTENPTSLESGASYLALPY